MSLFMLLVKIGLAAIGVVVVAFVLIMFGLLALNFAAMCYDISAKVESWWASLWSPPAADSSTESLPRQPQP